VTAAQIWIELLVKAEAVLEVKTALKEVPLPYRIPLLESENIM
jgi:hypothetical protein